MIPHLTFIPFSLVLRYSSNLFFIYFNSFLNLSTIGVIFVVYFLLFFILISYFNKYPMDSHVLETVWTVVPIVILLFMAFPSLYLLYLIEDISNPSVTFQVSGSQLYYGCEDSHTPLSNPYVLLCDKLVPYGSPVSGTSGPPISVSSRPLVPELSHSALQSVGINHELLSALNNVVLHQLDFYMSIAQDPTHGGMSDANFSHMTGWIKDQACFVACLNDINSSNYISPDQIIPTQIYLHLYINWLVLVYPTSVFPPS